MQTAQQKALIEQENMERVAKSFNTAMKGIGTIIKQFLCLKFRLNF
jgi:hypothetical protein